MLLTSAAATIARLRYAAELAEAVAGADLAIEVVPERIAIKRAVFAQLDALLGPDAILATNSSAIRVSLLEDATARPELVANLYFFYHQDTKTPRHQGLQKTSQSWYLGGYFEDFALARHQRLGVCEQRQHLGA